MQGHAGSPAAKAVVASSIAPRHAQQSSPLLQPAGRLVHGSQPRDRLVQLCCGLRCGDAGYPQAGR